MLRGDGQGKTQTAVAQKTEVAKTTGPAPLLLSLCLCRSVIDSLHLTSSQHAACIVLNGPHWEGIVHDNTPTNSPTSISSSHINNQKPYWIKNLKANTNNHTYIFSI